MEEVKIIIAFIFKQSGKKELNASEIYLPLSMQLNWFSPQEAKDFVKIAIKQKFLEEKKNLLNPNFEINKIDIPIGFKPTKKVFQKINEKKVKLPKKDLSSNIVDKIVEKSNLDKNTIIEKIKKAEQEKNINFDVAALLIGKELNINLENFFKEIEENIFKRNTAK